MVLVTCRFVFVKLLDMSTITHCYNYLSEMNAIWTLVEKEMYYGLIFLGTKQCKTVHDKLTTLYFIVKANLQ